MHGSTMTAALRGKTRAFHLCSLGALLLAACAHDSQPSAPGGGEGDDLDAGVVDRDAGGHGDADSATRGEDGGTLPLAENCTGEVFSFDAARATGRHVSLLVHEARAHLVYATPSCSGASAASTTQGLSYVTLGEEGEPSAPVPIANNDGCYLTQDPALYADGADVRVLYTSNARGHFDLFSTSVNQLPASPVQITDTSGNEVGSAVASLGGKPRLFFTRENAAQPDSTVAPIVSWSAPNAVEVVPETAAMNAPDLSITPLVDGASLGALAFVSALPRTGGLYLTLVDAEGHGKGSPLTLSAALGAGSVTALASNDDGGAVVYSEVPGGTAHQLRFRSLTKDGVLGDAVKLTTANQDLRDVAFTAFHGGYLAAYRRVGGSGSLVGSMRLLFVDEIGNVKMTSFVSDASASAATTQLAIGPDGNTIFIAWADVEGSTDKTTGMTTLVEHVRLARYTCPSVPKLTCD